MTMLNDEPINTDLFTFEWYEVIQEGQLQIGPSDEKSSVGFYSLRIIETDNMGNQYQSLVNVEIANGICVPDFQFPQVKQIKDSYEYQIGQDSAIKIELPDASNGNCFFDSKVEIEGPSQAILIFFPQILV